MNNLINFIRHFVVGVAFVGVMAGTGGFLGAVGGVIVGLLGQTVLGMASGMIMFMLIGIALGAVAAMMLGISLMRKPESRLAWQSGAVEQQ